MSGPQISIMSCLESAQRNFGDPIWILVTQFWHIFSTHLHQVVPVISRKKRRLLRFQHLQLWSFGRRGDLKRGAFFAGAHGHPGSKWIWIWSLGFISSVGKVGEDLWKRFHWGKCDWWKENLHQLIFDPDPCSPQTARIKILSFYEKIIPSLPQRFSHIS